MAYSNAMLPCRHIGGFVALRSVLIAAVLACSSRAGAAESVYQLRATVDVPLLAVSLAGWWSAAVVERQVHPDLCNPACRSNSLNALDATVTNNHVAGLRPAADLTLAGLITVSAVATIFPLKGKGRPSAIARMVILAETIAVTGAFTALIKHLAARPRPYMYDPDSADGYRRGDRRDYLSFFSSHTAIAFASAAAVSAMFAATYPGSRLRVPMILLSFSCAAAIGIFRIASGDHFFSDVAAGALVGTAIGIAIPAAHRTERPSIRFVPGPSSLGLHGSF